MDYKQIIDKLVRELSYRVGIPNIHNKEHQSIMSEILSEWGEYDVKQTIFEFLTNEDDTEGEDKQYSHIGAGIYVKKGDEKKDNAQKYKKDDSGSIKPISDDEYDKTKSSQGDDGEKAASNTDQNQQGGGSNDEKGNQEEPKTNAFSGDGGDEYKTFKNSKDAVAYAKELGKELKGGEAKEEPTKDSTKERAGNPKVNKVVRDKAKKLGVTPQKLGKEEYESRMSKAAVEALTDANFHSEARKLISILEDKPEWDSNPMNDPDKPKDVFSKEYDEWRKNTVFSSELYDSAEGTDEIAHLATNQSGWEGETSVDAIAYDLKMNGSKKLAAKIQSIFEGKVSNGFKNHSLKNLM